MMLVLKIPIVYLGLVVWYAIKAEPEPGVDPHEYSIWRPWRQRRRPASAPRRPARHARHRPRRGARVAIESRRELDRTRRAARPPRPWPASSLRRALFLGLLELAYRPFRLAPVAVILLLVATVMSPSSSG